MKPMNHLLFTFLLIIGLSLTILLRELHILLKGKNEILREYVKYIVIIVAIMTAMLLFTYPLLTIQYVQTL